MDAVWNLYRFDHSRYVQVKPHLRSAADPDAFANLADGPEIEAIVEAFIEREIDVIGARQDCFIALCCVGEPLPCPKHFPRIIQRMANDVRTEEGMQMLADAVAGSRNLESWLRPAGRLCGFLTPEETVIVSEMYWTAESRDRSLRGKRKRPIRRGGLLSTSTTFLRRLFDRGLATDEVYRLLGQVLEEAVQNGQGIAVVTL